MGLPRNVPPKDSLLMSSRPMVTTPLMSVSAAGNPSICIVTLFDSTRVVKSKLCQSRIGTVRLKSNAPSPLRATRSRLPLNTSMPIGLLANNERTESSGPAESPLMVRIGERKSPISIRAFVISLPSLIMKFRSVYRRMLSTTISRSTTSAAGQRRWYMIRASRMFASTRKRPSPPSNGHLSIGPYKRTVPRGICPASNPS